MYVYSRGASAGRSIWESIQEGTITIKNPKDRDESDKVSTYTIEKSDVSEVLHIWKDKEGKEHKLEIKYGIGLKEWEDGKLIKTERYKKGTNQARIFTGEWIKSEGSIESKPVTFNRKCYGGSFRSEIATYPSGKQAYKVSYGMRHVEVYYPNGKPWLTLLCPKGSKIKFSYTTTIFGRDIKAKENQYEWRHSGRIEMKNWDYTSMIDGGSYDVVVYDETGKIKTQGKCENRQKLGIWIENYDTKYYLVGVAVTEKMFNAKPEELDCNEILNLDNAQLRTSLMTKVGTERFLKECKAKLIDKEGDMELFTLPIKQVKGERTWQNGDTELHLLKVRCPSTGTYYVLKVPPDAMKCEEARRWTLGFRREDIVEFAEET